MENKNKTGETRPNIAIITINIHGLNSLIERQILRLN